MNEQNEQKRPYYGGGMPAGHKTRKTLDKLQAREVTRRLITRKLGPMVRAQIAHAQGISHFFLRDSKTGQFVRVTDPKAIEVALNTGESGSHYWIFTKDPSTAAFQLLLDRALDRAKEQEQEIRVTGEVELVHRLASARGRVKGKPEPLTIEASAVPGATPIAALAGAERPGTGTEHEAMPGRIQDIEREQVAGESTPVAGRPPGGLVG